MTGDALQAILRCPFCDGRLAYTAAPGGGPADGDLECDCCTYPVVDGIPVLRADDHTRELLALVQAGRPEEALDAALGVDGAGAAALRDAAGPGGTFRRALEVLGGEDAAYKLHRPSDPTYITSEAVVRAAVADPVCRRGPVLDACGGTGHVSRALVLAGADAVSTDVSFRALWLARRFVAPGARPVCCDANAALPFAAAAFSLVVCSDAFHYVWARRSFARELASATARDGTVVLTHLHNALAFNVSAGMPLAPGRYRGLFDGREPVLLDEREVLEAVLTGRPADLGAGRDDAALADAPTVALVAGRRPAPAPASAAAPLHAPGDRFVVNPLLEEAGRDGDARVLRLRLPSKGYEYEYGDALRRYVPEEVRLTDDDVRAPSAELLRRRVVLALPPAYL